MIRFFVTHPTASNIFMLFLMACGLAVLPELQRETFPHVQPYEIEITVPYPGAPPIDVEDSICRRLENAMDGISFLTEQRCDARNNLAIHILKMQEDGKFEQFKQDIKDAVDGINDFPALVEMPTYKERGTTSSVIAVAISADLPLHQLKAYAQDLKERMLSHPKIPLVKISGFSDHQLRVEIPIQNLYQYKLSINDIAHRIASQGIDLPVGTIESTDKEYALRFTDQRRTARDLETLTIVKGKNGGELKLGDIANIKDTFSNLEQSFEFNGLPSALLTVSKNKSDDTLEIFDEVSDFVANERKRAPHGIQLTLTNDRATVVKQRLSLLVTNGIQGVVFVFLTLLLFFNVRYSFWVAMGLPVSFLAGFVALVMLDITINMISMVALLMATGLLMDDAIVISESIASERKRGLSPMNAAITGAKKVASGVVSSFLTTIFMLGSLIFMKGDLGQVMKVLPIVLIVVLAVSLVEAFLILPHHLYRSLVHSAEKQPSTLRTQIDLRFDDLRESVGKLAEKTVKYRYATIGLVALLFLVSIGLMLSGVVKFKAFPKVEGDTIISRVLLPQGTTLARTKLVVHDIIDALKDTAKTLETENEENTPIIESVGVSFGTHSDAYESGAHLATINVDLSSEEVRTTSTSALIKQWRQRVPNHADVINLQFGEPSVGPAGRPIHIQLSGLPIEKLSLVSQKIQRWLAGYPGVSDILDDLRPGKPELRLTLREGALSLGIDAATIANQLRAAYQGAKAIDVQQGDESYEVQVRLDEDSRSNLSIFESLPIIHPVTGELIPLSNLVRIESARSYSRIHRVNKHRTVSIYADVDSELANVAGVLADTKTKLYPSLLKEHPDLVIQVQGESKNSAETNESLKRGFVIGLLGVFLLLCFQLKNYVEPFVVMITIPLALIGVIWGHLLMGLDITMPSIVGFISLSGVVVNDSILLVEFIQLRTKEGMRLQEAASQASRDRFRAVLLTSATTVAGLTPLLAETSRQAQVLIPLVVSTVFGMISSTLLVLFVVPALYSIFEDWGLTRKNHSEPDQ